MVCEILIFSFKSWGGVGWLWLLAGGGRLRDGGGGHFGVREVLHGLWQDFRR